MCAIEKGIQGVNRSLMWWIGDWLRYGKRKYGETYKRAFEETGKAEETYRNAIQDAERFEIGRRRPDLDWQHHREVSFLEDPAEAGSLLDTAESEGWSTRDLRAEVIGGKQPLAMAGR